LFNIGGKAFKVGPKETLLVSNNPILNVNSVHKLLKNLELTETIQMDGNGINSLPNNAFNPNSKVKNLYFHNNKIERIRTNTFFGLQELTYIILNNNKIHRMEENALNFSPQKNLSNIIHVFINDNNLTTSSFKNTTFERNEKISVELHLENNNINQLKEEVFEPFLSSGKNTLYLADNDFDCDCHMKWLLINEMARNNTYSVACNEQKKSLFKLDPKDLKCESSSTVSTTKPTTVTVTKLHSTPSTKTNTSSTTNPTSAQNTHNNNNTTTQKS
jgi:Leucine-rich repeat (LRR) protein